VQASAISHVRLQAGFGAGIGIGIGIGISIGILLHRAMNVGLIL
jgi:ABC-type nitrate/sulfonate/bicarbonate transport system permease component